MSTEEIIALLITERDKLNRAIEALQGPGKRRGRPPKNAGGLTTPVARLEAAGSPQAGTHRRSTERSGGTHESALGGQAEAGRVSREATSESLGARSQQAR